MIDLHSHVLPGVDDGAANLAEAIAMCRMAADDGTEVLVATPHLRHERFWNADRALLEERYATLRDAVAEFLDLRLGGEVAVASGCLNEVDALPDGGLLTLAGSRWLLLEFHHQGISGPDPVELVHEIHVAGWRVLLAHPERIAWLMDDLGLVEALCDAGARCQVTAASLSGRFGRRLEDTAVQLVDRGLCHLVASDAHDLELRPPVLSEARDRVAASWGDDAARALFVDHPRAVLDNSPFLDIPRYVDATQERDEGHRTSPSPLERLLPFLGRSSRRRSAS